MKPKPKKKKPNTYGVRPGAFPKDRRWRVDYDYLDKLSLEERQWLAAFTDAWVGGDFRGVDPDDWPKEVRSVVNQSKNMSRADTHTLAELQVGGLTSLTDKPRLEGPGSIDTTPVPDYLNDEDYKAARDEYRETLHQGRKPTDPVDTPAFRRAQRRLMKLVPPPTREPDEQDARQEADLFPQSGREPPGPRRRKS